MKPDEHYASIRANLHGAGEAPPPVLQGVAIRAALRGPLLDVLVEQSFRNAGPRDVEVVYTFPLPARAVLTGLEFKLGGIRYAGSIRPKQEATSQYEAAIAQGDTPVLVERTANGLFTAQLGNLKSGECAQIRLRYAQRLEGSADAWRIAIPTVLAPLYGDPELEAGLAPHQTPVNRMGAEYPLAFELLVGDMHDTAALACTSHAVDIGDSPEGLRLTSRAGARLDRDVVVNVQHAAGLLAVSAPDLPGAADDAHIALAAFCAPAKSFVSGAGRPLSLRIVLDCSGSMAGESIDWATVACQRLIGNLRTDDEFSITRFGSKQEHWKSRLVGADAASTRAAIDWLYGVSANLGGTQMQEALQAASELPGKEETSDILLITDGQIWAADHLIRASRRAGRRVFVIGVGSSPNGAFLRELAEATEGRCEMITLGESLPSAVDPLVDRMRSPFIESIDVHWPASPSWTLQWPQRPLPAETVFFYAGFQQACEGRVKVAVQEGGQTYEIGVDILPASQGAEALPQLAASERIRSGQFEDPARAAVDYQLVTEWTSLIAIAQREAKDRAGSLPLLAKVEQMIPAGWGATGRTEASRSRDPLAMPAIYRSAPADFFAPSSGYFRNLQASPALPEDAATGSRSRPGAQGQDASANRLQRRQDYIREHQEAFALCLQRLQRRSFAQSVSGGPAVSGLDLLRWSGLPEELLRELSSAGASNAKAEEFVEKFIVMFQAVLSSGGRVTALEGEPSALATILHKAVEAFLDKATEPEPETGIRSLIPPFLRKSAKSKTR